MPKLSNLTGRATTTKPVKLASNLTSLNCTGTMKTQTDTRTHAQASTGRHTHTCTGAVTGKHIYNTCALVLTRPLLAHTMKNIQWERKRSLSLSLSLFCALSSQALSGGRRWLPPTAETQIQNGDASLSRCSYAAAAAALLLLRICRIFIHKTRTFGSKWTGQLTTSQSCHLCARVGFPPRLWRGFF